MFCLGVDPACDFPSPADELGGLTRTPLITVRPDGQVGIMHLHSELLKLAQSMGKRGLPDG